MNQSQVGETRERTDRRRSDPLRKQGIFGQKDVIEVSTAGLEERFMIERLKSLIAENLGACPCIMKTPPTFFTIDPNLKVQTDPGTFGAVKDLVGENAYDCSSAVEEFEGGMNEIKAKQLAFVFHFLTSHASALQLFNSSNSSTPRLRNYK